MAPQAIDASPSGAQPVRSTTAGHPRSAGTSRCTRASAEARSAQIGPRLGPGATTVQGRLPASARPRRPPSSSRPPPRRRRRQPPGAELDRRHPRRSLASLRTCEEGGSSPRRHLHWGAPRLCAGGPSGSGVRGRREEGGPKAAAARAPPSRQTRATRGTERSKSPGSQCDLTVIREPLVAETVEVQMPPSNLSDNLGNLLKTGEEADVTFKVKGEVFPAHKIVLAMRSPVFKAELYGPMRDRTTRKITVEDMQPAVSRALLHFIYTDSLPSMEDLDDGENKEMVKHLLVAADRYALERLKLICEDILCQSLDVESVATMLALADQHHCSRLKEACVEFVTSANRMDDVVASQGYVHLKRSCPALLVDIFGRVTKSRKV